MREVRILANLTQPHIVPIHDVGETDGISTTRWIKCGRNATPKLTSSANPPTYDRRLGLFDGTMLVMGGIIGAGIFLNPAIVAQRVGSAGLTVGVWVLGGVIALAGAFCFAELGANRPKVGGGYVYLRDAFGPLPAFLYGWTLLLIIATGAIAAVAVTFARYFAALTGLPDGWIAPPLSRRFCCSQASTTSAFAPDR